MTHQRTIHGDIFLMGNLATVLGPFSHLPLFTDAPHAVLGRKGELRRGGLQDLQQPEADDDGVVRAGHH